MNALAEYSIEDLEAELERRRTRCQCAGCELPAEYEGWYRVRDFTGNKTGLNRQGHFCDKHARQMLIGFENQDVKP